MAGVGLGERVKLINMATTANPDKLQWITLWAVAMLIRPATSG